MKNHIIRFIKKETVLSAALFLAAASSFFVKPSIQYLEYIDFNTLFLLFSLMCVMADYKSLGAFEKCSRFLLSKTSGTTGIILVLVLLPFFFSMLITNDVALITFVPLALAALKMSGLEHIILPTVVLQTLAANLGSMFLPTGNPQNLYLYAWSSIPLSSFIKTMLPYTGASFVLLTACSMVMAKRNRMQTLPLQETSSAQTTPQKPEQNLEQNQVKVSKRRTARATICFILCILSVGKLLPQSLLCILVGLTYLFTSRKILKGIDYSLLMTFVGFFIFVGNIKNLESARTAIASLVTGNELLMAVYASQVISNVPAALLLSGFTENVRALLVGTNIGGLGTLIASMASLISFKQIARNYHDRRGPYFILFTIMNLAFLAILGTMAFFIER